MSRPRLGFLLSMLVLAGTSHPSAHEKFKIVGTVVKVEAAQLDVKAVDGQTYEIDFDGTATHVTRDGKRVAASELKPGRSVVVVALGHDMFDLEAVEVQIVPRPPD